MSLSRLRRRPDSEHIIRALWILKQSEEKNSHESTSTMTDQKNSSRGDRLFEVAWSPIIVQEDDEYSYKLFSPTAHRSWMAEARKTIDSWISAKNEDQGGVLIKMEQLISCCQDEAYDEGFDSANSHLQEQTEARFEERESLLSDLRECRRAIELIVERPKGTSEYNTEFLRRAARRYAQLSCGPLTTEQESEYKLFELIFEPS